jgi:beta-carotene hydroxylase
MSHDPALPSLNALGRDLLVTTSRQRRWALTRPFVLLALYAFVCALDLFWLTPIVVFFIFVAIVTVTHDVVHGSLGLSRRGTDVALFVFGAVLLASGHSYRMTHLQHHRVFPRDDDPEGDPARMTLWAAVRHGAVFLPRLWTWAHRRAGTTDRRWMLAEAIWMICVVLAGVLLWPVTPAVLLYAGLVMTGAWVFPLLTVHLPHRNYGDTPLTQTHTLRGRIIPALFLELTYHLEHHLYPQVPSHQLRALSGRLEPFFDRAGVVRWHVP